MSDLTITLEGETLSRSFARVLISDAEGRVATVTARVGSIYGADGGLYPSVELTVCYEESGDCKEPDE